MTAGFSISVIIPTYNRQVLVQRAIHSVINQTIPANEIIVVDDGSNDQTLSIIRKKYPQVQCFRIGHGGISLARNFGIQQANGDWIGFLDSDDTWLPYKLEKQIKFLKKYPSYQICHTNEIWIRKGKRVNPKLKHQKYGGFIFERCLPLCVISPSSVLIHKDLFLTFGMFDPDLQVCEDYELWLRICAFIPVLYIDEPLIVKYGGHKDQLSKKYWGMDRFRIIALEKLLQNDRLEINQRIAVLQTLIQKIEIYIQGARKRKKLDEIRYYEEKMKLINAMLNRLQGF